MNGETFPCGRVAGALRKRLFREHLGYMEADPERAGVSLDDPVAEHFYRNVWKATSRKNTEIYEEVSVQGLCRSTKTRGMQRRERILRF